MASYSPWSHKESNTVKQLTPNLTLPYVKAKFIGFPNKLDLQTNFQHGTRSHVGDFICNALGLLFLSSPNF